MRNRYSEAFARPIRIVDCVSTTGTLDDKVHFPACQESKDRVVIFALQAAFFHIGRQRLSLSMLVRQSDGQTLSATPSQPLFQAGALAKKPSTFSVVMNVAGGVKLARNEWPAGMLHRPFCRIS